MLAWLAKELKEKFVADIVGCEEPFGGKSTGKVLRQRQNNLYSTELNMI